MSLKTNKQNNTWQNLKVAKAHNKTYTCRNTNLQRKQKKQLTNGESLNLTHRSCYEKRKTTNIKCYFYMKQKS